MVLVSPLLFAFERSQNDNGTVCYYWKNRSVSFRLNKDCSKDVNITDCTQAVQNSIGAWMGHSCSDLELNFAGTTTQTSIGMDYVNLIVWRQSNDWKYENSAIAMTTTTFNTYTGEIVDADIEVNGVDYTFSVSPPDTPGVPGTMDIQNTLTHELGHCIGLADVFDKADSDATMYYTAGYGDTNKSTLSQDDINGLCTIYPAGAATPLCSETGNVVGDGGCATTSDNVDGISVLALLALVLCLTRKYCRRVPLG